jgi:hypothetical protein
MGNDKRKVGMITPAILGTFRLKMTSPQGNLLMSGYHWITNPKQWWGMMTADSGS